MISFIKTMDGDNEFDFTDVNISTHNDVKLEELLEAFKRFILGVGFVIPEDSELDFVNNEFDNNEFDNNEFDNNEKLYKEVEVDLTEDTFMSLAKTAHEKNITFNQLCEELLIKYIENGESER